VPSNPRNEPASRVSLTTEGDLRRVLREELTRAAANWRSEDRAASRPPSRVVDVGPLTLIAGDAEFIAAACRTILRRDPDVSGFVNFHELLRRGVPRTLIVHQLTSLDEAGRDGHTFVGMWVPMPVPDLLRLEGTEFVRQVFRSVLWREPDPASLATCRRALAEGRTREDLLRETALSEEGRLVPRVADGLEAFVQGTAIPDSEGDDLEAEDSGALLFTGPPEEFVARAYWAVLRRAADPGGQAHWLGALRAGASRRALLLELLDSTESRILADERPTVRHRHAVLRRLAEGASGLVAGEHASPA